MHGWMGRCMACLVDWYAASKLWVHAASGRLNGAFFCYASSSCGCRPCLPAHLPTSGRRYTPRPWMVELQGVVPELKAGQTEIDGERAIPKWPETSADVKIPSVRSSSRPARLAACSTCGHDCQPLPATCSCSLLQPARVSSLKTLNPGPCRAREFLARSPQLLLPAPAPRAPAPACPACRCGP